MCKYYLTVNEAEELLNLINIFKDKGFKTGSELSEYIHKKGLDRSKYPNITGELTMANEEKSWIFKDGLSPKVYSVICELLKLGNKGSDAKPTHFKSYAKQNKEEKPPSW